MALPSSNRSIGERAITTLPANRSLIVADSRYRVNNPKDEPYDFTCNLGGTGIYAKELYYLKLHWNQPIFAHNNTSNELRFQMNGDESITYIVYATPFLMYTQYDGNKPGTSLLPPKTYSYANDMELALNGDVRTSTDNYDLYNGDGLIRDPNGVIINMRFRYAPSRGFCIYPEQNFVAYPNGYSIRLLPCNYIANAHFVHGFGIFDPAVDPVDYTPYSFFTAAYWSDTTPNLLPMRYIVIQSPELNKDRRMISFHNGNFANFVNELTIFSLNPARTGVTHEVATGDDATVISLRDDYTPQRFRISILDEYGDQIVCDDPIRNLLASGVPISDLDSFVFGPLTNRGNHNFTNYLLFGFNTDIITGTQTLEMRVDYLNAAPNGMFNKTVPVVYNTSPDISVVNQNTYTPILLTGSPLVDDGSNNTGFQYLNGRVFYNSVPGLGYVSVFNWWKAKNANPVIQWDSIWFSSVSYLGAVLPQMQIWIGMYAVEFAFQAIGWLHLGHNNSPPPTDSSGNYILPNGVAASWVWNNAFNINFPPDPTIPVKVCFCYVVLHDVLTAAPVILNSTYFLPDTTVPTFRIFNNYGPAVDVGYIEPTTTLDYPFGNPQASALCEEVIHEISAVNEYN